MLIFEITADYRFWSHCRPNDLKEKKQGLNKRIIRSINVAPSQDPRKFYLVEAPRGKNFAEFYQSWLPKAATESAVTINKATTADAKAFHRRARMYTQYDDRIDLYTVPRGLRLLQLQQISPSLQQDAA